MTISKKVRVFKTKEIINLLDCVSVEELSHSTKIPIEKLKNKIKVGALLALDFNQELLIPVFQLSESFRLLGEIESVNTLLDKEGVISPEAKISFYLNPLINFNNQEEKPSDILQRKFDLPEVEMIENEVPIFARSIE